ncbi:MAG: hypothetical protein DRI34_08705 [Deltaproteobacteria bacterium]|nr:MAG: hypothetical protein DRI34_08705 [Deltaproteobacteria bacterium]
MNRLTLFTLALLVLGNALSPAEARAARRAVIAIRVIYAVKDGAKSIDPALDDIRGELEELPASKFRLLDRISTEVDEGAAVELQLPGDKSISVRFTGVDQVKGKRMLGLQLALKPALKISLRLADGGRTLIGGPVHLEGRLVLDVSARVEEKEDKK